MKSLYLHRLILLSCTYGALIGVRTRLGSMTFSLYETFKLPPTHQYQLFLVQQSACRLGKHLSCCVGLSRVLPQVELMHLKHDSLRLQGHYILGNLFNLLLMSEVKVIEGDWHTPQSCIPLVDSKGLLLIHFFILGGAPILHLLDSLFHDIFDRFEFGVKQGEHSVELLPQLIVLFLLELQKPISLDDFLFMDLSLSGKLSL